MDQGGASPPKHTPKWVAIDFEAAAVLPGSAPGLYVLTVKGQTHRDGELSLGVRLAAGKEYLTQPEYWKIDVQFDIADTLLPVDTPYEVSLPLDRILGSKGVEVAGRTKSVKIGIP